VEEKAIRGIGWTFLTLAGSRLVQIAGTVVLARLLVPADFGLVALGLTISILLGLLASLGLGGVFVVERELDERAKGTYLTLFLVMGASFALLMAALAPLAARFFGDERLTGVVVGLSAMVFFSGGLNWFYEAVMQRELEFRKRFVAQMVQAVSYSGSAIALAALGAGVWSLVVGQLIGAAAYAAALVSLAPYRVRPAFDSRAAGAGLREGRGFLVQGVTTFAAQNVDFLVIGRVLGAVQLGFYSMAYRLGELPNWFISESVAKVTFPGFARMRHRGEDVAPAFLSALGLVAFATCPLGVVLSAAAEPLTLVVFGERWEGMIGPLTVLGIWAAVRPLRGTAGWFLNSVGHAGVLGRLSLLMLAALLPAVYAAARLGGITAVAWVVVAEAAVSLGVIALIAERRAGVPVRGQWRVLRPVALGCPLAWGACRLAAEATASQPCGVTLAAALAAGLAAYLAAVALIDPALPRHAVGQVRRMLSRTSLAASAP
jgi:lipopolysaccharide exporter